LQPPQSSWPTNTSIGLPVWACAMRVADDGAVAELVGIECGVVSGVFNLELSGIEVPDWRPRHDKHYHEA